MFPTSIYSTFIQAWRRACALKTLFQFSNCISWSNKIYLHLFFCIRWKEPFYLRITKGNTSFVITMRECQEVVDRAWSCSASFNIALNKTDHKKVYTSQAAIQQSHTVAHFVEHLLHRQQHQMLLLHHHPSAGVSR